jgi:hypothetical protein
VLHDHVRMRALDVGVEGAQQHRMGERLERLHLASEAAQGVLLIDEIRPQDLRDHHAIAALVPDQVDLIAVAPAERLQRGPARGDLMPLGELP